MSIPVKVVHKEKTKPNNYDIRYHQTKIQFLLGKMLFPDDHDH